VCVKERQCKYLVCLDITQKYQDIDTFQDPRIWCRSTLVSHETLFLIHISDAYHRLSSRKTTVALYRSASSSSIVQCRSWADIFTLRYLPLNSMFRDIGRWFRQSLRPLLAPIAPRAPRRSCDPSLTFCHLRLNLTAPF
jgi:hypothetical protein